MCSALTETCYGPNLVYKHVLGILLSLRASEIQSLLDQICFYDVLLHSW